MKQFLAAPVEEIYERAKSYDYISFDIFDTLVKRDVAGPEQVFDLVELRYNREHDCKIVGFTVHRIEAEKRARQAAGKKEIDISQIYRELDYDEKTRQELAELEIGTEKSVCVPNIPLAEIYERLRSEGKTIYLISDMYLPETAIGEILKQCRIRGYKKLYLSAVKRRDKRHGLYEIFLKEERLDGKTVLHIGDNFIRDHLYPKAVGINSLWLRNGEKRFKYARRRRDKSLESDVLASFIDNRLAGKTDIDYCTGYAVFGPLLYAFTKWLFSSVCGGNYNKILFIARDAYPLQKAFNIINECGWKGDAHYLCLSRLTILGELFDGTFDKKRLIEEVADRVVLSLEKLLIRMNAYGKGSLELAQESGLDLQNDLFLARPLGKKEAEFLDRVIEQKRPQFSAEAKIFEDYVSQYTADGDKAAVVDIGWHGTAQYALETAVRKLCIDCDIDGFYLGTDARKYQARLHLRTQGFLANERSGQEQWLKIKATLWLIEFFAAAPQGTTVSYRRENGKVLPVFKEETTEEFRAAKNTVDKAVFELQRGALDFVRDFRDSRLSSCVTFNEEQAFAPLFDLCAFPTEQVLERFGDLPYFDTQYSYVAKPRPLIHYLFHPDALKNDLGNSGWKIGFMRRLAHNFPLPYYSIYKTLMKMFAK